MNFADKNDRLLNNVFDSPGQAFDKMDYDELCFHLKSLSDSSVELINIESFDRMIETFLLIIMGNFGASMGFIVWIETETDITKVKSRGIDIDGLKFLHECLPEICNNLISLAPSKSASVKEIKNNAWYVLCPEETDILFQWHTGSGISGLAGLGKKISLESFNHLDIQFLNTFISCFIPSLCLSGTIAAVHKLNTDIDNKNIELAQLAQQTEHANEMLNRRLYYLNNLYDTLVELGNFSNSETISETFLLMILGTFSARGGYTLLLNKNDNTSRFSCRGIARQELDKIPVSVFKKILNAFLKKNGQQNQPLSDIRPDIRSNIRIVTDKKLLNEISMPLEPGIGVFFYLDETESGIIVLGNKITDEDYSKEDQDILRTLSNNYILFLKNALSFEIVKNLNKDLELRNIELKKTIQELKVSQNRIKVLETVKSHFKSIITNELEKSRKMALKDFIIILFTGLVLGLVFNFANPEGIHIIPGSYFRKSPPFIDAIEAKQKYDSGTALLIDARPTNFFEQEHIQGAENLPLPLFDFVYMMKLSSIDLKKEIIIYGRNISKHYDEEAAFKLGARNHENLKLLSGGIKAWKKMGFPTEP